MAGFVALGNDKYIGTLTLSTSGGVKNGTFVVPNWANGTVAAGTAGTGDAEVLFVENENDTVVEDIVTDLDYTVKQGDFVRGKVPQAGEILVTTEFNGTPAVGDVLAVGASGKVEAVAARTPKYKFVVKEKTTEYGVDTLRLAVL